MVWACGKNGGLPYGQKGVDGRSQWGTGTRETEVRWMDGVKVALGNRVSWYDVKLVINSP